MIWSNIFCKPYSITVFILGTLQEAEKMGKQEAELLVNSEMED